MAEWKSIVGKYVTFWEKKDHWTCNLCLSNCTGHRNRVIAHLTRNPGNGVKICKKITSEQVEELKRELGLGRDLTGAEGQQPQQPGDNDDIRQENGNKKRKSLSGSGTCGSSQREAEMSPSVALNPSSALGESISVSDWNIRSPENVEKSIAATGLRLDSPEHNSSFSVFDIISFPPETWDGAPMMTSSGGCVQNTDKGGFQGTNAVGSSGLFDIIHQGQSSSSQSEVDHRNDQHIHPPTSTLRYTFDAEMAGEIVLDDEPHPPCPPGFDPDLWELYLEIESKIDCWYGRKFPLYEECMSSTDEEERKVLFGFLESACCKVRNGLTSAPRDDRHIRSKLRSTFHIEELTYKVGKGLAQLDDRIFRVEEIENEIRGEKEHGDEMLLRKRKNDTNRWVGYAASFKSDVDDLNAAARNVRSLQPEEILQLLSRANELTKIGDIVIATGLSLLHPVPKDILSWNPTYVSCGSQLVNRNQMPPTQFTPQV